MPVHCTLATAVPDVFVVQHPVVVGVTNPLRRALQRSPPPHACTLQHWISKTQALPIQFESARHAAVTLLKSNAVHAPLYALLLNLNRNQMKRYEVRDCPICTTSHE